MKPIIAGPLIFLLLLRAYRRNSLTPLGLVVAGLSATIHALPDSALPFTLLGTFFLLGTAVTKVKHAEKAKFTLSSSGSSGGEGPRTHVQVLANSGCATILCALEWVTRQPVLGGECLALGSRNSRSTWLDVCILGCVANYAAVAADTCSSELGILAKMRPVLITQPWRKVPKGTNGGVTMAGVAYGHMGALIIAVTSVMLVPFCPGEWDFNSRAMFVAAASAWGTTGSLLDSLLGALLQASVVDKRTGKIVEGDGGVKVKTRGRSGSSSGVNGNDNATLRSRKPAGGVQDKAAVEVMTGHESRSIHSGRDILDNNGINFLMASVMTIGGIVLGQLARAVN